MQNLAIFFLLKVLCGVFLLICSPVQSFVVFSQTLWETLTLLTLILDTVVNSHPLLQDSQWFAIRHFTTHKDAYYVIPLHSAMTTVLSLSSKTKSTSIPEVLSQYNFQKLHNLWHTFNCNYNIIITNFFIRLQMLSTTWTTVIILNILGVNIVFLIFVVLTLFLSDFMIL